MGTSRKLAPWQPGDGVVEHAGVDDRRLDGAIGTRGGHHAQAVLGGDQPREGVDAGHAPTISSGVASDVEQPHLAIDAAGRSHRSICSG
jgi:hypothetical protein